MQTRCVLGSRWVSLLTGVVTFAATGCTTASSVPPATDTAMIKRMQQAFELEKQRRAGVQNPSYAPRNPGLDSIAGLRASLASEHERRTQIEKELVQLRAKGAERGRANAEVASLRAELSGERNRNLALKQELERVKDASKDGPTQEELDKLEGQLTRERQRRQSLESELALLTKGKQGSGEAAPELARLRQELEQERRRRLEVEKAWARLREETSVPALGATVSESEFLALKQELLETQHALDAEREAHRKAEERSASTEAVAGKASVAAASTQETQRLRDRVSSLQRERDALKRAITELTADSDGEGGHDPARSN